MLDDFRIAKLIFNFLACGDGRLPKYKGSTLRGGFGYVFRDIVCSKEQKDCGTCESRDNCVYVYLFETPVIQPEDKFSKYSDVPRPYIVDLCDTSKSVFARGDPFQFGLVLVGKAIDYLPHFIFCFDELGRRGLGKEKLKFDLQVVSGFDFAKGQWTPIYDPDTNLLRDDFPTASANQLPFNCKDTQGETIRAHRGKRTTGLFLVGLSAFTRILRSTSLERIQRFFYRIFVGWTWPHKLEIILQNQKC